ncbi:MAG: MarC family protein [Candidatus Omnitrophica bacterium]|nr:MarC family protein [Candidatus Omnitrophota bacterium]
MDLQTFVLAFIPLFVAVDPVGLLPVFINLTSHLKPSERAAIVRQSLLTAFVVAVAFLLVGKWVLDRVGVSIWDFSIAGGLILFILSITDLLATQKARRLPVSTIGAVPLGVPLIVGPAVLTTSLLLLHNYGPVVTLVSLIVNILFVGLTFMAAKRMVRVIGEQGAVVVSKVSSLFLAAIAVMLIRRGLVELLRGG